MLNLLFLFNSVLLSVMPEPVPVLPSVLVPVQVVNARSAQPYQRYGIDFDGNCYSCNLAELQVTDTVVWLRNVCDSNLKQALHLLSVQHNGAQEVLRCSEGVLVLEKMNEAPVFRLTQPVPPRVNDKLRLRNFYTDKSRLHRFSVHDCGDFQG